jgi:hypothetical protein
MSRSTVMAFVSVMLVVGCVSWLPFGLAVKYLVDLVALGHSLAKTILLLLFVLALSLLVKWVPEVSSRWAYRFAWLLPLFFLANLGQYLWYCSRFGIEANGWSAVVRDGFWSMSRLDHTHTAKAMLSSLPTWLATKTDVGYALGAVFPQPVLWAQLGLFLLTIGLCMLSCVYRLRNDSVGRATSFVLTSFVLVKCLVDGGVLIPEVWAAAPVFAGLVFGRKGVVVCGLLALAYLGSLFFWKPGALAIIFLDWLPALLMLSAPLVWERSHRAALALCLVVLWAPVARYQLVPESRFRPHSLNTAAYIWQDLKQDWKVYIVSNGRLSVPSTEFHVESELFNDATGYCLTTITLTTDITVLDLSQALGLESVRRPISWYQGPVQVKAKALVLDGSVQEILSSPLIKSSDQRGDTLELLFVPGVNKDLAVSALGPHLTVVHDFVLSYPDSSK